MHNAVEVIFREYLFECSAISDINFRDVVSRIVELILNVVTLDRRIVEVVEIVNDSDALNAGRKQPINQMRTNKACAASDEKVFHLAFCSINPQMPAPSRRHL